MTVGELIALLDRYPEDMIVVDSDNSEIMSVETGKLTHSMTGQGDNMDVWEESEDVVKIS